MYTTLPIRDRTVQPLQSTSPPTDIHTSVPEPRPQFLDPTGYSARHVHDKAPFSHWDPLNHIFNHPTTDQKRWLSATYNASAIHYLHPFITIVSDTPPETMSLTVACMVAIFVPSNVSYTLDLFGAGDRAYANPRLPDPCPDVQWPRFSNPAKAQMMKVIEAMGSRINVEGVVFMPTHTVIELESGDGRSYKPGEGR